MYEKKEYPKPTIVKSIEKKSAIKSTDKIFFIKDVFIEIFFDFISELNKIPSAEDKVSHLRKVLYRSPDNKAEFNIIIGHFIKRLVVTPPIKDKFLPLDTCNQLHKETVVGKLINFPELDFCVEYGVNEEQLRPFFEEYIYSESGKLQEFLCKFINGDNVFKIPKNLLRELYETKRLRVKEYMTLNSISKLHKYFLDTPILKKLNMYLDFKLNPKFKGFIIPSDQEIYEYNRKFNTKAILRENRDRRYKIWVDKVNSNIPIDTKYPLRYPVVLYKGSVNNKRKLLYYVKYGGLVRTNIEGLLRNYFDTVFSKKYRQRILYVGYLNEDNSLDVIILTEESDIVKSFLLERAIKIQFNLKFLTKELRKIRKNMDFYAEEFGIRRLRVHKQEGFIFSSLHYLLNYLLLNIAQGDKVPITILFRNFVILNNGVNFKKALMTKTNGGTRLATFVYLDTKEEVQLHYSRLSESLEIIPNFLNKEVFVFNFERGADFVLLAPMRKFTFDEEVYSEKVNKLRHFNQIIDYNNTDIQII